MCWKTHIYTWICMHTYTSTKLNFNCFSGAGYFSKQSRDLFKSCSVQRFTNLLKERLTCSRTTGWGQLKTTVQKWAHTHQEEKKKEKMPDQPILSSQECSVERSGQLHSPLVWPGGASAGWPPQPGWAEESKRQSWKVLEKKLNPPTGMKLQSEGMKLLIFRVHSPPLAGESLSSSHFQSDALSTRTMIVTHCCAYLFNSFIKA